MMAEFTGRFDSLLTNIITGTQKAVFCINEEARETFEALKDCEKLVITVKKFRRKRSIDANAYFHVLVGKIADEMAISKARCKNILIGRYGQPELLDDGSEAVMKANVPVEWMLEQEALHCRCIGSREEDGKELLFYKIYRGSHTYDTKEMSALIDGTVAEAKDQGIETITPGQLERLKHDWESGRAVMKSPL